MSIARSSESLFGGLTLVLLQEGRGTYPADVVPSGSQRQDYESCRVALQYTNGSLHQVRCTFEEGVVMANRHAPSPRPTDARFVFRPWRRCPRTGEKLWAKDYGLKAWRIPISESGERGTIVEI